MDEVVLRTYLKLEDCCYSDTVVPIATNSFDVGLE